MRIAMVAVGSTGDVRPYLILARALQRRGHTLRLIAFSRFETAAKEEGLDFIPLPGNLQRFMEGLMRPGAGALSFLPEAGKAISGCRDALMDSILRGCGDADAVITTFSASAVYSVAEKLRIPCLQSCYFPLDPNSLYPLPVFPPWRLGAFYARATYRIAYFLLCRYERHILAPWREREGIAPPPLSSAPVREIGGRPIPVLCAVSPRLLPRPREWGAHIHMTGFWQDTQAERFTPPAALRDFLAAGQPPVYIGFGSMVAGDMAGLFRLAAQAALSCGQRVLLDGGWRADALPELRHPDVYVNREMLNHDWLFPRVRAVVHHGGAGTTASGLRAGKPTLILPFATDQNFWGAQIYRRQLGPRPLPRTRVNARRLTRAMRDLCENPLYAQSAARMGELLRGEDGAEAAADIVEREIAAQRGTQS